MLDSLSEKITLALTLTLTPAPRRVEWSQRVLNTLSEKIDLSGR